MSYDAIPAVNWSSLKEMDASPKEYMHRLTHPRPDTAARKLGRAVHAAVYEPEAFDDRHVVFGGKTRRGEAWEQFEEEHADCEILTANERTLALLMRDALYAQAGEYLRGGFAEQTLTWFDEETGLQCKGRVDQVNGRLIELKTTRSASLRAFASDARKYGYNGQVAFYADGLAANGILLEATPLLIAVQSEPPFDVVVYEVMETTLSGGRRLYRRLLQRLMVCRETNTWPGASGGEIVPLEIDTWDDPEEVLTLGGIAVEMD